MDQNDATRWGRARGNVSWPNSVIFALALRFGTTGKASSKTDINNVLLHVSTDTNGHTWVIVAADRFSTSGDSYIDFEFLQHSLVASNNGTFTSTGPDGGRTANDLLLSIGFTSG